MKYVCVSLPKRTFLLSLTVCEIEVLVQLARSAHDRRSENFMSDTGYFSMLESCLDPRCVLLSIAGL